MAGVAVMEIPAGIDYIEAVTFIVSGLGVGVVISVLAALTRIGRG